MNLQDRIKAPTPDWFKRIIAIGLSLSGIGLAILGIPAMLPDFQLPHTLKEVASWFVVAGTVAAAVSKTAKQDNPNA